MNNKNLLKVIVATILAVAVAWFMIDKIVTSDSAKLQGKLVFANTFDYGDKVDKIIITTSDDTIELHQEKSFWYVMNKGGYFADFKLIHNFLTSINESIYSVKLPDDKNLIEEKCLQNPMTQKNKSGILIQTYANEKMLDEIIVGVADNQGKYFFARRPQSNDIWLIDGNFNLPINAKYWLLHPVLSIPYTSVESVTLANKYVQRENKNGYFINENGNMVNINPLLNVLTKVIIVDAEKAKIFDNNMYKEKIIDVITFYGLEFICRVYYNQDDVWLNVALTTTPLPMKPVIGYINDNRFLYDGWFFKISPEQGHILRDFYIM